MMIGQSCKDCNPSHEDVCRQLESILDSPDFTATPQQAAFLKYVVSQTLAGKTDRIKGYTIATEVFGRRSDFDQSIDPIVSIQAAGLRRALARYYQKAGRKDALRIDIPKGTFVPTFSEARPRGLTTAHTVDRKAPVICESCNWPSVLVRPLQNLSGDADIDYWGVGLASEIADELSRYPDIRVVITGSDDQSTVNGNCSARFVIDGCVRSDGSDIKVILSLVDTHTNRQVWSNSYRSAVDAAKTIDYQEDIARAVAVKVAGKQGGIATTLDRRSKGQPAPYSLPYEAILRCEAFNLTSNPESLQEAMATLEKAVARHPECGQVWVVRARLFAQIYGLDIPGSGIDRPLDQAARSAQKGLQRSPESQRAHSVMAYIHLLGDQLEMGRHEAQQALQLGPETLFVLDAIGYVLTLLGDWEQGPALIERVIRLNPFYSNDVHYALWLNWLRQGDHARAHQETLKLNRPANFWDHLARAATCGLLGHIEDGRRAAAELLRLKPDFPGRGHMLIRRYIKFEDLVEQVIAGLGTVGVKTGEELVN